MSKISSEDIRIAIKRGRGLPVDAALEMVDMLDQWQRTATAGKDACARLEGEIDAIRAKLRVAVEALEASFATCADSPCKACAIAARNSHAALAKIRATECPSEVTIPKGSLITVEDLSGHATEVRFMQDGKCVGKIENLAGPIPAVPRGCNDGCELPEIRTED